MSDPLSILANTNATEEEDENDLEKELERELMGGDEGGSAPHTNHSLSDEQLELELEIDNEVSDRKAAHDTEALGNDSFKSKGGNCDTEEDTTTTGVDAELGESGKSNRSISNQSSVTSASAKLDTEAFGDTKDLYIVVDKSEKVIKTMESYVTFAITTKTTRSDFEKPEYFVRRRYNDFLWLRQSLEESYPYLIIPPLPEKHNLTIDRFDREFIRFRQVALHRFMGRLAQHPTISVDENLMKFITLDTPEFLSFKKTGAGILSRVSKSLHTIGGSYMLKNRSEEHTNLYEYANRFSQIMGAVDRITQRLSAENSDYLASLENYVSGFRSWAEAEEELQGSLNAMAQLYEDIHKDYSFMTEENALKMSLPVKEYILFCDSIKSTLARRDAVEHEFEVINEGLEKLITEKNQVHHQVNPLFTVTMESGEQTSAGGLFGRSGTEEQRQTKAAKLEARIEELSKGKEECQERLEKANETLSADMVRWHHRKKVDVKEMLGGLADRNIELYDKHIHCLEDTLTLVKESMKIDES